MKRILAVIVMILLAPLAATAQEYQIKPGDVLRVEVLEDAALNRNTLVLPDGRISFPMAGSISAAGLTVSQLQSAISTGLAPNFANAPTVFVSLDALAAPVAPRNGAAITPTIGVFVMGEVANPGRIEVTPGTTVLQFLAQSGGFSRFAATKRIQLRRIDAGGVEQVYAIDYQAMERGASGVGATVLANGDVIIVPQRRLFE